MNKVITDLFQDLGRFFIPILVRDVFITPAILFLGFGIILFGFSTIYFFDLTAGDAFWNSFEELVLRFFDSKDYQGSLTPIILKGFALASFVLSGVDFLTFRLKGDLLFRLNPFVLAYFFLGLLGYISFIVCLSSQTEFTVIDLYVVGFFLGVSLTASIIAYIADRLLKIFFKMMDTCLS